jgi:glycosyltransferase involved in cell wall biosynthesis
MGENPAVPVALIIPALDEEHAIGALLAAVDRRLIRDVLVGDNGSRDATAAVARAGGAEVVHVAERGYGAACAGALTRLRDDVDVVLFMDADGSDDPRSRPSSGRSWKAARTWSSAPGSTWSAVR